MLQGAYEVKIAETPKNLEKHGLLHSISILLNSCCRSLQHSMEGGYYTTWDAKPCGVHFLKPYAKKRAFIDNMCLDRGLKNSIGGTGSRHSDTRRPPKFGQHLFQISTGHRHANC